MEAAQGVRAQGWLGAAVWIATEFAPPFFQVRCATLRIEPVTLTTMVRQDSRRFSRRTMRAALRPYIVRGDPFRSRGFHRLLECERLGLRGGTLRLVPVAPLRSYPPVKPEALRLPAPQRGLIATGESKSKNKSKCLIVPASSTVGAEAQ
jgi:hypothetical protein